MATGSISFTPQWVVFKDGVIAPGALLYTYASGGSTPLSVYSDVTLLTPRSNPVVADADGVLPTFYLAQSAYRFELKDSAGVTIWGPVDNITDPLGIFSGNVTIGGILDVDGFGSHMFSAGGTGNNLIALRNTTAGTANSAFYAVGNDTAQNFGVLQAFSSTFTTSGPNIANAVKLNATYSAAGGLTIAAEHATTGIIGFYTGTTLRGTITAAGVLEWVGNVYAPAFRTTTALVTATDGGSTGAFTANMVGSTGGPTTAAQNGWVKAQDSTGATIWIPVWK